MWQNSAPRAAMEPREWRSSDALGEFETALERERHRRKPIAGIIHEFEVIVVLIGVQANNGVRHRNAP